MEKGRTSRALGTTMMLLLAAFFALATLLFHSSDKQVSTNVQEEPSKSEKAEQQRSRFCHMDLVFFSSIALMACHWVGLCCAAFTCSP